MPPQDNQFGAEAQAKTVPWPCGGLGPAALLTLTGLNLIANAFSMKGFVTAHHPKASVTVGVSNVRVLV